MKNFFKHEFGFLRRRIFQIYPQEKIRIAQQRRHQEHFYVLAMEPALSGKHE
jgi:hypothetical protein